jgi:dethiobiotin synthetase
MLMMISGTDTNVGKTVVTAALLAYGRKYLGNQKWTVLKPIQCGVGDREFYEAVFGLEQTNPIYFEDPLAPPIAAAKAGKSIDLALVWQSLQQLQGSHDRVFIEPAGGLGTPMTAELVVADIAREWRLPTLLVAPVKLGSIGAIVANVALARQRNVDLRGIVLNCPQPMTPAEIADLTPIETIVSLTHTPVLGILPHLDRIDDLDVLAHAASNLELLDPIVPAIGSSNKIH